MVSAAISSNVASGRQTVEFPPSVWGDFFLTHTFETDEVVDQWKEEIEVLKYEVKSMLVESAEEINNSAAERLNLIDAVHRLGIGYLFEPEIERLIRRELDEHETYTDNDQDIRTVALRFRILRQHGFNVPSGNYVPLICPVIFHFPPRFHLTFSTVQLEDQFNKFKNEEGEFKKELTCDIEGMLSLYDAGYMRTHGETILDDAINFTKPHLGIKGAEFYAGSDVSPLAERVARALEWPLRKDMEKLQHLFFIRNYEKIHGHNQTLLKLAKLCFNVIQNLYQKELKVITKWWIELDLVTKASYGRDRLLENYYWAIGCTWEPKYSMARRFLTKALTVVTFLDDTYDIYGSFEELELLTSTVIRWDTTPSAMEALEIKCRTVFQSFIDAYDEIEAITTEEGRPYCVEYAKQGLHTTVKLYFEERKWLAKDIMPTLEEYKKISSLSTVYQQMVCLTLSGMGELASKEAFEWLLAFPEILLASSDHCRLMDDIVTYELESKRGHPPSSVQVYMNQFGVTKEEAIEALFSMIEDDWRTINREMLNPQLTDADVDVVHIPKEVRSILLGFAQVMEVLYKGADWYTFSGTIIKDQLTAMLVTPIQL
ncbi:(-)-germacrene D synthase [Linum grandiflorum]